MLVLSFLYMCLRVYFKDLKFSTFFPWGSALEYLLSSPSMLFVGPISSASKTFGSNLYSATFAMTRAMVCFFFFDFVFYFAVYFEWQQAFSRLLHVRQPRDTMRTYSNLIGRLFLEKDGKSGIFLITTKTNTRTKLLQPFTENEWRLNIWEDSHTTSWTKSNQKIHT